MIAPETLKRIKHIEICTRRLLNGALVGDSRSAIKGSGFEFDQMREYQPGDDVRFIDWKSSARMNRILVKQYIEERSRAIVIAVDVSASSFYSSGQTEKYATMAEIAAVISLVADYGKDGIGLLLFSDEIEAFIPPNKGRLHVHKIMQKLFEQKSTKKTTRFKQPLEKIASLGRSDTLVVLISDFIDIHRESGVEKLLYAVTKKSDVVAIRCLDELELVLPKVGFLVVQDSESGQEQVLDLRAPEKTGLSGFLERRAHQQASFLKRYGVETLDVVAGKPFINTIIRFFRQRSTY